MSQNTIAIAPFIYEKSNSRVESQAENARIDDGETMIETFTLKNNKSIVPIDIYNIINKRRDTSRHQQQQSDDDYWINWDCNTHTFTKCQNLYDKIDEKLKIIIFFIGFRTMIYGDHLHDFGSSKVYATDQTNQKETWSLILFKGCLIDIRWFINKIIPPKSKATQQSSNIEKKIINILKYLLLNQFLFWYTKTIKNLSQDSKILITKKYKQQEANICSITTLDDYIKIFKYIDFCGYFCGKIISDGGSGRARRGEDGKEPLPQHVKTLHDDLGKFICNWALKSIFCIYSKSIKNLLGCDEEQLSQNFKDQNIHIFDKIYKKPPPTGANDNNTIIQLRIDQEGDTRNHLALFNSIAGYTRQYVTCENNNIDTNEDNNNITSNFDNDMRYIVNLLSNKANNGLGIIYDYAGWQDPGCNTLPRLRSDLATLNNELQILVPNLDIQQVYYFASIPIIQYTYHGPARGCTYNQFFKYVFDKPAPLSASETSVENIKKRTKELVNPSIQTQGKENVITSNLTIKTFGDLNQCIIFGYYYGNQGFYKNQNKFYLPIFMTGDIIAGYMSALISNQVITEKHDKSNTIRKHTRELVDGVIYYLNCSEKDNYEKYIAELNVIKFTKLLDAVGDHYIEEDLQKVFNSVYPEEEEIVEHDVEAAIEELRKVDTLDSSSMDLDSKKDMDLNEDDILNLFDSSNILENEPRKKRKQGEGQKGKQTHKNKAKRAKRTKRAKRARRTKRANIDLQTNTSLEP